MNRTFKLNTGHSIPLIGFGTFQVHGAELINGVLDFALAAGYRHIDTAVVYRNEQYIGAALKTLLPKYNLKREDIFITSKLIPRVNQTEEDLIGIVKNSLAQLQTDYLDLYLIHWPGVSGLKTDHPDNRIYRNLAWSALTQCHKQGMLRSIGVSNFTIKHLEEFLTTQSVAPAVNQVEWHPYYHQADLLSFCRKHDIFLQAYSSLGSSNFASLRLDPTVLKTAAKLQKSAAQILLRWAFQQDIGVLPKGSSRPHIDENIALDFVIPDELMETLSNMQITEKFAWNPEGIF